VIEEKKKTAEYEGFLKEVQATGFVEQSDGVTCISQIKACVIGPGGKNIKALVEKFGGELI
jgi:transcription antitermination factor NusA-like protein